MRCLMILMLSLFLVSCAGECSQDSDCVPATCCHADSCVPADQAPDCSDAFCTMECKPGTMDCGQGSCKCNDGKCEAVIDQ